MGSTIYANNGTTSKLYFSTAYGLLSKIKQRPGPIYCLSGNAGALQKICKNTQFLVGILKTFTK